MSDSLIYGICDSCEKKYKVPSADKTYPCKACGGTVSVHEMHEDRTASERFNARRRTRGTSLGAKIGMVLGLVLLGGGLIGYQVGMFGTVLGSDVDARLYEMDIEQVGTALADKWIQGDTAGLAAMHHPTGQGEFATRLSMIAERRSWGETCPALDKRAGVLDAGTAEAPESGATMARFGDSYLRVKWQYDGNVERWFIYNFWLSPTKLAPKVEEFRTAWAESDVAALHPLFGAAKADKLDELFTKQLKKAGWTGAQPTLGDILITGEEHGQEPVGEFFGAKVESVFEGGDDSITIRWRFDQATDAWRISGLRF